MPVEQINWDKHDVVTCDDRGRATLGSEYAGERVFVYVAEIPEVGELANESVDSETANVLTDMLRWARENDIDTMTHLLNPDTGVVTDKDGNKHQSPYSLEKPEDAKPCPACGGTGERELRECSICDGYGTVLVEGLDDE